MLHTILLINKSNNWTIVVLGRATAKTITIIVNNVFICRMTHKITKSKIETDI